MIRIVVSVDGGEDVAAVASWLQDALSAQYRWDDITINYRTDQGEQELQVTPEEDE